MSACGAAFDIVVSINARRRAPHRTDVRRSAYCNAGCKMSASPQEIIRLAVESYSLNGNNSPGAEVRSGSTSSTKRRPVRMDRLLHFIPKELFADEINVLPQHINLLSVRAGHLA